MSAQKGSEKPTSQTKKFGKGEREVPHHTQKAKKFYPAEDESKPKKVRKSIKPARPRPSLAPGSVLILLAGRFRGKRVVLLKHLPQGVLLITGPYKANGVPLRRVNARYVIATSAKVDLKGIDDKVVEKVAEEGYFTREKKNDKVGEEAFFKQGEKPEVSDNHVSEKERDSENSEGENAWCDQETQANKYILAEEEDFQRSCERPESRRQGIVDQHQKRAHALAVPTEFFQSTSRRQTTPNEMVDRDHG
ncbi:MAG: hypothetical protein Q9221_000658 [Calogaya cf. arnoldii]